MKRVYNFNAGPSPMPLEVLEAMKNDLTDFKGTGMGITEISHRSKEFQDMLDETKALLRELMHLDDDYEIVFIQGGGTMQFLMTAYNFLHTRAAFALATKSASISAFARLKVTFMRLLASFSA
jgi:phosphoserine aminotransferase